MRHCVVLCAAAALFLSPVLAESLRGQEQQQQPQRPSVQVGVPDGRGGARPSAEQQGAGRGRQAGPPAAPTPRNADGRAIFSTPGKKGVWLPGGGGATTPNAAGANVSCQPCERAGCAAR